MVSVAAALSEGTAVLTHLSLIDNNIGPEGAKALADALNSGRAVLTKLDVRGNYGLNDEAKQALRDAVREREGFKLEV